MKYEICYLVGESREVDLDAIKKNVEAIVVKSGGEFLEGEFSEKRKMAYEINKEVRGTYIARRFEVSDEARNAAVAEITKELNLNGDVMRFIVVKADELPELVSNYAKQAESQKSSEEKKEEVKSEAKKEVKKEAKKEEIKKEVKEEKKEESTKEEVKEEKSGKKEDFDKKLDELLNI